MSIQTVFDELVEQIEQMITARNLEEYMIEYPDAEGPPIPYATVKETTYALWRESVPRVHAEVVTSGSDGRATVTFEEMAAPVVAVGQTTSHTVIVEAVTGTSVTVRVLDGATGVPDVGVHVTVTDTTIPAGS